ncbi:unnamed protein product [Trichobilharzia regenti]|nr:unnamed protein product [Trichobilharzia regenti]
MLNMYCLSSSLFVQRKHLLDSPTLNFLRLTRQTWNEHNVVLQNGELHDLANFPMDSSPREISDYLMCFDAKCISKNVPDASSFFFTVIGLNARSLAKILSLTGYRSDYNSDDSANNPDSVGNSEISPDDADENNIT